jgi:ATP-grasp domain-containing protein
MTLRAVAAPAPRVALATDDDRTAVEVARVAAERGVPVERLGLEAAVAAPVGAIAYAPATAPDAARAAELARLCAAAAENHRPIVILAAFERARGRALEERVAALAYLRAHGAILAEDPDVWFEASVLMAVWGAPAGPRLAIIAPPGGWLALQAAAESVGLTGDGEELPADLVLVDGRLDAPAPERAGRALVVPVVARAELALGDRQTLVGLRAAVAAAVAAGRHTERLRQGLGPAPVTDARKLKVDRARVEDALKSDALGDHETKRLLSAYGVAVTRQAVAQTPSALVRYAQQLGWPVEILPWEPTTRAGLISGVRNPPEARRAFAAAAAASGLNVGVPVIVRATPPPGRSLAARIERAGALGWTVSLTVPGADLPLAAPAPLRRADADELAAGALAASRAGDAPPDRAALADLLSRASLAIVENEAAVEGVELERIVVGKKGEGAVVVEARARVRRKGR